MAIRTIPAMDQRLDFVQQATAPGANVSALCRIFGISRDTGYRYLARYRRAGEAGLVPQSRRPQQSPRQTSVPIEQRVLAARTAHPTWGGRKLHHWLARQDPWFAEMALPVPAPSTITGILRRAHLLGGNRTGFPRAYLRFERAAPNQLWQMDFLGHMPLATGDRVHVLTILDDHTRFLIGLIACANEQTVTVRAALTTCFTTYGLPNELLADNGPPWGTTGGKGLTRLEVWLLQLSIRLSHGRPYHPQTQGKVERCHQTIGFDVFAQSSAPFADLAAAQQALNQFREVYNAQRPHEALGFAVPTDRYHTSDRRFPAVLAPMTYPADTIVRTVNYQGNIMLSRRHYFVSEGLVGQPVAIEPTSDPTVFTVRYGTRRIVDIRLPPATGATK